MRLKNVLKLLKTDKYQYEQGETKLSDINVWGYCRCSTLKQTIENQRFVITQYAEQNGIRINHWVEETISSRKPLNKRKLSELLDHLKSGDLLIVSELSRLGRSMMEIMGIMQKCLDIKCQVFAIKENFHLGDNLESKILAFCFGISAEVERTLISERTKSSLEKLKKEGKKLGRPLGAKSKSLKLSKNKKKVFKLLEQGIPKVQIARALKVDKMTVHRFIKSCQSD